MSFCEYSVSSYDGYAMRTIPEPPLPPGLPVSAGVVSLVPPPPPDPVFSNAYPPGVVLDGDPAPPPPEPPVPKVPG